MACVPCAMRRTHLPPMRSVMVHLEGSGSCRAPHRRQPGEWGGGGHAWPGHVTDVGRAAARRACWRQRPLPPLPPPYYACWLANAPCLMGRGIHKKARRGEGEAVHVHVPVPLPGRPAWAHLLAAARHDRPDVGGKGLPVCGAAARRHAPHNLEDIVFRELHACMGGRHGAQARRVNRTMADYMAADNDCCLSGG